MNVDPRGGSGHVAVRIEVSPKRLDPRGAPGCVVLGQRRDPADGELRMGGRNGAQAVQDHLRSDGVDRRKRPVAGGEDVEDLVGLPP